MEIYLGLTPPGKIEFSKQLYLEDQEAYLQELLDLRPKQKEPLNEEQP